MRLCHTATERGAASPGACAREVLETVPLVMRVIRTVMRRHRPGGVSVPQFRTLALLGRRAGVSLSEAADHIGVSLPAMSHLIDGLVSRRLVLRRPSAVDRRRVTLRLTAAGHSALTAVRRGTRVGLAPLVARLSAHERETVVRAMRSLRGLAGPGRDPQPRGRTVAP